jgi:SAM-dependent methyltransferase
MEFHYSDGLEVEDRILELLRQSSDLSSMADIIGPEQYELWPMRYHLSPERANLLRHFDFSGLRVVELGAGMGAISRFLAEQAESLVVVEGSERRFAALRHRLSDLDNWSGEVGRFENFDHEEGFDVVCLIGTLEYAGNFIQAPEAFAGDSFDYSLNRAARLLNPGGVLVLAIENPIGLKYWSGSGEDHSGELFSGVVGYGDGQTAETFPLRQLRQRLTRCGLTIEELYYPFPDYKLPQSVIGAELARIDPALATDLACFRQFEGSGHQRSYLFPDYLALEHLGRAGLFESFANSYLLAACTDPESATLHRLLGRRVAGREVGWHYSPRRRQPIVTVFETQGEAEIRVSKRGMEGQPLAQASCGDLDLPSGRTPLAWHEPSGGTVLRGGRPRQSLLRRIYFCREAAFLDELSSFIEWVLLQFAGRSRDELRGKALDAVFSNAIRDPEGGYRLYDQEWVLEGPFPKTWFILRNVLALSADRHWFNRGFGFASLAELYEILCRRFDLPPELDRDLALETEFQARVIRETHAHLDQELRGVLTQSFQHRLLPPKDPAFLAEWVVDAAEMDSRTANLEATIDSHVTAIRWHQRTIESHEEGMEWLRQTMEYHQRTSEEQATALGQTKEELVTASAQVQRLQAQVRGESAEVKALRAVLSSRRHRWVEGVHGVFQRFFRSSWLLDRLRRGRHRLTSRRAAPPDSQP